MSACYFEDYFEGEVITTPGRTITEADIVNFAGFTGDWAEMHTNEEFSKGAYFGQRIAHGALTFAVSTGLIVRSGALSDEATIGFYGIDRLRYLKPVLIGDTIKCEIKVMGKQDKGKDGVVDLDIRILNQQGEAVVLYNMKILSKKTNKGE
jgi:acyl dehydratase